MAKQRRKATQADPESSKRKRSGGLLGTLLTLALLVGGGFFALNYIATQFDAPGPATEEQVFTVPRGAGLSRIAGTLESEGLIRNADMFKLLAKIEGGETGLKAGEYAIPAAATPRDIYGVLMEGKALLYPFTVPEGQTSAQIMRAMGQIATVIDDNPPVPAEGTLLPETYLTPRGMTRSALIKKMQDAQTALLDEAWENRQPNLPIKTKQEALILASVVEKETGIDGERDMVAGVFINRLNKGMRLESDPTIIYGITKGEPLGRGIRRSEIKRKTEWNTYQIDGLPITPICNPGREAILAVLNPAETDAIFFVADGTGGHAFGRTLKEHNDNVAKWRKIERARKKKAAQ